MKSSLFYEMFLHFLCCILWAIHKLRNFFTTKEFGLSSIRIIKIVLFTSYYL